MARRNYTWVHVLMYYSLILLAITTPPVVYEIYIALLFRRAWRRRAREVANGR
jgi:hypothetical protein